MNDPQTKAAGASGRNKILMFILPAYLIAARQVICWAPGKKQRLPPRGELGGFGFRRG